MSILPSRPSDSPVPAPRPLGFTSSFLSAAPQYFTKLQSWMAQEAPRLSFLTTEVVGLRACEDVGL